MDNVGKCGSLRLYDECKKAIELLNENIFRVKLLGQMLNTVSMNTLRSLEYRLT